MCRYMNQQGARWCTQETRSVPLNTGYKQCEPPFPHLYSEWGQLKVILVPFTLDSTRMNSRHSEYLQTGPRRNNHRNVVSCFPGMAGISMSGADISTFAMWPPPLYINTHTHTHTHRAFNSFTVLLLGSGLALPVMSLKLLHKDPPSFRECSTLSPSYRMEQLEHRV